MIELEKTTLRVLLALLALGAPVAAKGPLPLVAQEGEEPAAEGEGAEGDADAKEEDEEEHFFAVIGGEVYTGTGAVLRGATVLARNGKITEIGYGVFVPEDAKVLDATGYRVYPGLVAAEAAASIVRASGGEAEPELDVHADGPDRLGRPAGAWPGSSGLGDLHVHVGGGGEGGEDGIEPTQEEGEEERSSVADGYDPFDYRVVLSLSAGITTVGSSNAAVKLKRDSIDGVVLNERQLVLFAFTSSNPSGKRSLREKLDKASEYVREYWTWQEQKKKNKDLAEPSTKGVDMKVVGVLRGVVKAKFQVSDRKDLLEVARLAQQYGFRPVIESCLEGWTVADELGRAGAYAIVTPRAREDKDEHLVRAGGSSIENAAILHQHGVQVAVVPANTGIDMGGETGRDLLHLPIEAGFAVRGGLSEQAALASITLVPARILGVDHRVGSLEVGKDCDLIVTDGDVLHYETFVQYAVVEGKVAYDKEEELFFRHIRPRPKKAEPEPAPAEEPAAEGAEPAPEGTPAPEEAPEESPEEGGDEEGDGDEGDGGDGGDGGDEGDGRV